VIIEETTTVAAPLDAVWALLRDVPRVAGCIPGVTLEQVVDDVTYRAAATVKVGPVSVSYRATIVVESIDDAAHRATLHVRGDETRGRGGMQARVTSEASAAGAETRLALRADATVSGAVAAVGGRLIESVAKKTIAQFAQNVAALLATRPA
jgi:uncharacterized protein